MLDLEECSIVTIVLFSKGSMSTDGFVCNVNLRHNVLLKRSKYWIPSILLDKHCCYSTHKSLQTYKCASMEIMQDCCCMSVRDDNKHRHVILTVAQAEQNCKNRLFSATWAVNTGLVSACGCRQWQTVLQPASNGVSLMWI